MHARFIPRALGIVEGDGSAGEIDIACAARSSWVGRCPPKAIATSKASLCARSGARSSRRKNAPSSGARGDDGALG